MPINGTVPYGFSISSSRNLQTMHMCRVFAYELMNKSVDSARMHIQFHTKVSVHMQIKPAREKEQKLHLR